MGTEHTLIIFLDVESAKEHDCLFSKNTPIYGVGWVDTRTTHIESAYIAA